MAQLNKIVFLPPGGQALFKALEVNQQYFLLSVISGSHHRREYCNCFLRNTAKEEQNSFSLQHIVQNG